MSNFWGAVQISDDLGLLEEWKISDIDIDKVVD